jgi:hypothetical protein
MPIHVLSHAILPLPKTLAGFQKDHPSRQQEIALAMMLAE